MSAAIWFWIGMFLWLVLGIAGSWPADGKWTWRGTPAGGVLLFLLLCLLSGCAVPHGYVRFAPHTDDGIHAQALAVAPVTERLSVEQLLDVQTIHGADFYISETHLLYALSPTWSVFAYYRADSFEQGWEERGGVGFQLNF